MLLAFSEHGYPLQRVTLYFDILGLVLRWRKRLIQGRQRLFHRYGFLHPLRTVINPGVWISNKVVS